MSIFGRVLLFVNFFSFFLFIFFPPSLGGQGRRKKKKEKIGQPDREGSERALRGEKGGGVYVIS